MTLAQNVATQTTAFTGAFTPIVNNGRLLGTALNAFMLNVSAQIVAFVGVMQQVLNSGRLAGTSLNALSINAAYASVSIVGAINSLTSAIQSAAARFNAMRVPSVGAGLAIPTVDGSHANGLPYVPKDGYIAELHRGERVMTARENREYSRGGGNGGGISVSIPKLADTLIVREDADIDRIADALVRRIYAAGEAGA
jgi:hypothetical protein